jgi:hypothetical protein
MISEKYLTVIEDAYNTTLVRITKKESHDFTI